MISETFCVSIPRAFYADHMHRDLPGGVIEDWSATRFNVRMDMETLDELLSDAEFYSECVRDMGRDYIGLQSSARATVKALRSAKAALVGE
jgi:hypothetical protein